MAGHVQHIRQHNSLHFPTGSDPLVGPWIYVGNASGVTYQGIDPNNGMPVPPGAPAPIGMLSIPSFQNSWGNVGGSYQKMRFRWVLGHGSEIMGSVTGGSSGTIIFTLPNIDLYLWNHSAEGIVIQAGSTSTGSFVPYRVFPSGDVYHGF